MPPKPIKDDKLFGVKNKKGGKMQKMASQIQAQQIHDAKQKMSAKEKQKEAEKKAEKEKKETLDVFKPIIAVQKIPFGVDPKGIVCEFFKAGTCTKGAKCKFSHDLNVARKGAKIDLFTDTREQERAEKEADKMEDWDTDKLAEVVNKKLGKNKPTETDIVCKYFLDAIENEKYGWFWECPNGGVNCKYKHALPPGFILRKKGEKAEAVKEISIEELVEVERAKLGSDLTPITQASFSAWKTKRLEYQAAQAKIEAEKLASSRLKAGVLTGKELFQLNPETYGATGEDEEDAWEGEYKNRDDSDNEDENANAGVGVDSQDKSMKVDTPLNVSSDMLDALPEP